MTDLPHPPAPLRPVSDEHRHEPADYELEPSELGACPFCGPGELQTFRLGSIHLVQCVNCDIERTGRTEAEAIAAWNQRASLATQAPRSCCADEVARERARCLAGVERLKQCEVTVPNRQRFDLADLNRIHRRTCAAIAEEIEGTAEWKPIVEASHDG